MQRLIYKGRLDFDCLLRNCLPLVVVVSVPVVKHPSELHDLFYKVYNYYL